MFDHVRHCKLGVKAVEYGIIGEVIFWAFLRVLAEDYTAEVHRAWVKIFSRIIGIIIPISVGYELESGQAQRDRLETIEYINSPRINGIQGSLDTDTDAVLQYSVPL